METMAVREGTKWFKMVPRFVRETRTLLYRINISWFSTFPVLDVETVSVIVTGSRNWNILVPNDTACENTLCLISEGRTRGSV